MPAAEYLFQMAGGVPVVIAPAEIDTTTLSRLRAILFDWQSRGHTTLVMDMTATVLRPDGFLNKRPAISSFANMGDVHAFRIMFYSDDRRVTEFLVL